MLIYSRNESKLVPIVLCLGLPKVLKHVKKVAQKGLAFCSFSNFPFAKVVCTLFSSPKSISYSMCSFLTIFIQTTVFTKMLFMKDVDVIVNCCKNTILNGCIHKNGKQMHSLVFNIHS